MFILLCNAPFENYLRRPIGLSRGLPELAHAALTCKVLKSGVSQRPNLSAKDGAFERLLASREHTIGVSR